MLNLDRQHLAIAKFGDGGEHLGCLLLEPEVRECSFVAGAVLSAHLQLLDETRGGFEHGLAGFDAQALNPAKIKGLEQFDKSPLCSGQGRFCDRLIQLGTPVRKLKELPERSRRASLCLMPFPALSSQRQSNAFKREALRRAWQFATFDMAIVAEES